MILIPTPKLASREPSPHALLGQAEKSALALLAKRGGSSLIGTGYLRPHLITIAHSGQSAVGMSLESYMALQRLRLIETLPGGESQLTEKGRRTLLELKSSSPSSALKNLVADPSPFPAH